MKDWITNQLLKLAGPSIVASIVRGLLKFIAGVLATIGVQQATVGSLEEPLLEIAGAALAYFLAQAASNIDKKERTKIVEEKEQ